MKKAIYSQDGKILTEHLKQGRKAAGLTIRNLADMMGIHHSIVGKIETGERRLDVIEFVEYCSVLKLDPHTIIEAIIKANQ